MSRLMIAVGIVVCLAVACNKVSSTGPTAPVKFEQNTVVVEFTYPDWALQWWWTGQDTVWSWCQNYEVRNVSREYIHDVLCWFQIDTAEVFVVYHNWGDFRPKEEKSGALWVGQYELAQAAVSPPHLKDFGAWWEEYGGN